MRVAPAGVSFSVTPVRALSPAERAALDRLPRATAGPAGRVFRLKVSPMQPGGAAAVSESGPAEVKVGGAEVELTHESFTARFDPGGCAGEVWRSGDRPFPLEVTVRTAMCCRLPLVGGLALHAAGVVMDGRGVVFFGPSGAGKTTIARSSPFPTISDELIAVAGEPWELRSTGFWGEMGGNGGPVGPAPLAALVEPAAGPRLELTPLAGSLAFRRLLNVVVLPPVPDLWHAAAGHLARLVAEVPVLRMAWNPADPPWPALAEYLKANDGGSDSRRRRQG